MKTSNLRLIGTELKNKNQLVLTGVSKLQGLIDSGTFTKGEMMNQVSSGVNNNFETVCSEYNLSGDELNALSQLADKHLLTINSKFK